ncbi:MAG: choice-of-anchor L domain-containing protein [Planctomycetota bacterium]
MQVAPHAVLIAFATAALARTSWANDIVPGTPGGFDGAARELFADPSNVIQVTSVTLTANAASACAPLTPDTTQFGRATGFAARGGFVLANGYVEDLDNDAHAQGTGGTCFTPGGDIGAPGADCTGLDLVLSALLGGVPTEDAAILKVEFDVAVASKIDVSYNFLTFESPSTATAFADVFGIVLDGELVAGGASNFGPAGGDPWSLSPVPLAEYQSIAPSGLHTMPGFETGRRTVAIRVEAGSHALSFHVADSGPPAGCGLGADPLVHSALFVGLHTFQGVAADGVGSRAGFAPTIDRVGHPAPALGQGGNFPADFQVTLNGAAGNAPVFLLRGNGILPPTTIPLLAPHQLLVGPQLASFSLVTDGLGRAAFPPTPIAITATIVGVRIHFQWFGLDSAGFFNTKGMRVDFGL